MINVALLGAGRIGRIHAANLAQHPAAKLRYVADVYAPAAVELAACYSAIPCSTTEALNDPQVGCVVICTSTDTHVDMIERAAAVGKAIFCEKPIDLDLTRARGCADAVNRADVACMIAFQRRFDPTFKALKQRLDAGEIGTAEVLVITSRDPSPPSLEYLSHSGGIFKDMLIHDFDIFRWVMDEEVESIHATGACPHYHEIAALGDVSSAVVTLRTRSGGLCVINASRRAAYGYDQRFEVLGSEGMLQASNVRPSQVVAWNDQHISIDKPEAFFLQRYKEAYALEMGCFLDAVSRREQVPTSIEDGIKALELADLATISWREQRSIVC